MHDLSGSQAKVHSNMRQIKMLTQNLLQLTDREMALLCVAVTEMQAAGYDPFKERFMIQVAPRLHSTHIFQLFEPQGS